MPRWRTALPLWRLRSELWDRLRPLLAVAVGVASRAVERCGDRLGVHAEAASGPEIVAAYGRGWVLFGVGTSGLQGLEWRRFPRRAVITRDSAHVPKRLRPIQRRGDFDVRFDEDFDAIIEHCREGRSGWLTDRAVEVYRELHDLGLTATVGTYRDGRLVGGMWGVAFGRVFGIMSMFHHENHAGALALAAVADAVGSGERWSLVDCGLLNDNFERYGAYEVPVDTFCELVWDASRPGR